MSSLTPARALKVIAGVHRAALVTSPRRGRYRDAGATAHKDVLSEDSVIWKFLLTPAIALGLLLGLTTTSSPPATAACLRTMTRDMTPATGAPPHDDAVSGAGVESGIQVSRVESHS